MIHPQRVLFLGLLAICAIAFVASLPTALQHTSSTPTTSPIGQTFSAATHVHATVLPTVVVPHSQADCTPVPLDPTREAQQSPTAPLAPLLRIDVGDYRVLSDTTATVIIGYLVNTGTSAVETIQLKALLHDGNGTLLKTGYANYLRAILPAGERSPFLIPVDKELVWVSEQLQIEATPSVPMKGMASLQAPGLALTEIVTFLPDPMNTNSYRITGTVTNEDTVAAILVEVIGIAYDGSGKPMDVSRAYPRQPEIGSYSQAPIVLEFRRLKAEPASYT